MNPYDSSLTNLIETAAVIIPNREANYQQSKSSLRIISLYIHSSFSEHINWRIMLAVGILPSVFIDFALFIIPESPRRLVMQKQIEEARPVLLKTNESDREVEERLADIQQAAGVANCENYDEKPVWVRAQASALGVVGNRVCSGFLAMYFLYVSRAITVAGAFFVFAAISSLAIVFVYKFVPETKGKSLE
ncbi:hypothetical protein Fmac_019297 [Flemingia macrophylla]|uniref:Uncharacterized protein n=1 Tax=Flemingia macrophylla TaxID=520843 RepID=A0ABD1M7F6_9FABA